MISQSRHILAFLAALLTAAPLVYVAYRRGAFARLGAWWRRSSVAARLAAIVLVLSSIAYGSDKILGEGMDEGLRSIPNTVSTLCTNAFHAIGRLTGYIVSSVATNETHDFTPPSSATVAERIARRGAHNDGFWLFDDFTNGFSRAGLSHENPVWVHSDGTVTVRSPAPGIPIEEVALYTTYSNIIVYAPLQGSYGFLPASLWSDPQPSRIWTAVTDRGTRVITWENALLARDPSSPVSFQAEFHPNGDVTYRYSSIPTNTLPIGLYRHSAPSIIYGAAGTGLDNLTQSPLSSQGFHGNLSTLQPLNLSTIHWSYIGDLGDGTSDSDGDGLTDWQEIMETHTDPHRADTDLDGLSDWDEAGGGTDPRNPDEDGDGIADGVLPEQIARLLAPSTGDADLTLTFTYPGRVPTRGPGTPEGVILLDGCPFIVANGTSIAFMLPRDRTVDFSYYSLSGDTVSVGVDGGGTPVLVEDPDGLFAGKAHGVAGGRLLMTNIFRLECANQAISGPCVHEVPGTRQYRAILGADEWGAWKQYAIVTGENADAGNLTMHVADNPSSSASLSASFLPETMLVGELSASAAIHRCEAGCLGHEYCVVCFGESPHTEGLNITPDRAVLGVNTADSATFSVTGGSYVRNPSWALSPSVPGGPTLIPDGDQATVHPGTATGVYTLTASGGGLSDSAIVVVYGVDYLTIESDAFPQEQGIVHFQGMEPHPFNVTNSPVPDLHQPFFYKDAQTNFVVRPFTVDLVAHLTPDEITDDDVACSWSLDSYDVDGTFEDADSLVAQFAPTSGGGVYRFSFSCGSVSNSEAVLVLPLSGARIDEIVMNDIARADAFAERVIAKFTPKERNFRANGERWFYEWSAGDYVGRPDNDNHSTVWAYNQVDTSPLADGDINKNYGLGACGTLCGLPIRLTKISNFMVGYACEKIGVSRFRQWLSQLKGTWNDSSARMSWNAGQQLANGGDATIILTNLVQTVWDLSGPKGQQQWPSVHVPDNYLPNGQMVDNPDREFGSPGFLNMTDP